MGPLAPLFDFADLRRAARCFFHAAPEEFRTGWFLESMATQILVIFVIRTRRNPLRSRPAPWLVVSSLGAVLVAIVLPFTPLGAWFGFEPPPPALLGALAVLVVGYLLAAGVLHHGFVRRHG